MTKCVTPVTAKAITEARGNSPNTPKPPPNGRASRKTGTPTGIDKVVACTAEPVITPRRTPALVIAKLTAEIKAKNAPSMLSPIAAASLDLRRGPAQRFLRPELVDRHLSRREVLLMHVFADQLDILAIGGRGDAVFPGIGTEESALFFPIGLIPGERHDARIGKVLVGKLFRFLESI